ncbi:conserved hypothetical protein [Arthrobacter sp. 9V]|nr:conserved hypothetical protein [Arthrobacter sp. 9V]
MSKSAENWTIEITAGSRQILDKKITEAESIARNRAISEGQRGILVARHAAGKVTVSLSEDVPYGCTHETQCW